MESRQVNIAEFDTLAVPLRDAGECSCRQSSAPDATKEDVADGWPATLRARGVRRYVTVILIHRNGGARDDVDVDIFKSDIAHGATATVSCLDSQWMKHQV